MPEHIYKKEDLIKRFDTILNKTFEEIDNKGIFEHFQEVKLQKGIAGSVIEQCVLGYAPDTKQEADLIVISGCEKNETELKTTGMLISDNHFIAKEPMSITAVGVHDISEQKFENSHFWNKIQHMLIVYYEYLKRKDRKITAYDYKDFPIKGYEFHEFTQEEIEGLKIDWEYVHDLCEEVVNRHPGPRSKEWKNEVKDDYIDSHGILRRLLTYIDLAPTYPPRFRFKQPFVSGIIAKHFGQELEQLPGRYIVLNDIDKKCHELTQKYRLMSIGEIADIFSIPRVTDKGKENKAIAEQVIVKMFGGNASSLNQVSIFVKFGLIAKSISVTPFGGRTEDMKLFKIDFDEIVKETIEEINEDGYLITRTLEFEDSDLYSYFADHEFLCILFEEPAKEYMVDENGEYKRDNKGRRIEINHPLCMNKFLGFERLVFSDEFINNKVKKLWEDTRDKVINKKLVDVVQTRKNGSLIINADGNASSAPNFMKSKENDVFVRGAGKDSALINKTEVVNGIRMLPQYYWIKGASVINELALQKKVSNENDYKNKDIRMVAEDIIPYGTK